MTVDEYMHQGIDRMLSQWRAALLTDDELERAIVELVRAYRADVVAESGR